MARTPEDRLKARTMYVMDGLPMSAIAMRLCLTERTVFRWKTEAGRAGDSWDKARVAYRLSKDSVAQTTQVFLEAFMGYQQRLLGEVQDNAELSTKEKVAAIASLTDTFHKTVKASASTAPKLNEFAIVSDVIQRLATFVAEHHPDAAPALLAILEPFGQELAKVYG